MNSGKLSHSAIWLLLVFAGIGCAIEQPFEAAYTEDEDWTPSIQLTQNAYRRIVLSIDRPPRQSLLRNIGEYHVVIQTKTDLSITDIDSFHGSWIHPVYLVPQFSHPYFSGPVLNHEVEYRVRVDLLYRSGAKVSSNAIDFRTPPSRGSIIKEFSLPQKVPGSMWSFEDVMAFHGNDLIVLRDDQLFRVDTASGTSTLIKNKFLPPEDFLNTFRSFTVVQDTLVTYYFSWVTETLTLVRLSLETLAVDSSTRVPYSNAAPLAISAFEGRILLHFLKNDNRHQFWKIDPRTGNILQEYPSFAWTDRNWNTFVSDGANIWTSLSEDYNSRYVQIDPSTGSVVRELPNPVFRHQALAFDGSHFWQIDTEIQKIVKVRPAGF